jgi:hypothetical protein
MERTQAVEEKSFRGRKAVMRSSFPYIWHFPLTAEELTAGQERRRWPYKKLFS